MFAFHSAHLRTARVAVLAVLALIVGLAGLSLQSTRPLVAAGPTEPPQLIADINQEFDGGNPQFIVDTPDGVFLSADDEINGRELYYRDDSTGTLTMIDIYPGSGGSSPLHPVWFDGALYFSANYPDFGRELWRSDGTDAGTHMVRDLADGPSSGSPMYPVVFDGALWFSASDGIHGRELWRSEGDYATTLMMEDISTDADASVSWLTVVEHSGGDQLFFSADGDLFDPTTKSGQEIWRYDPAGSQLLDQTHGSDGTYPYALAAMGDVLYFVGSDHSELGHPRYAWRLEVPVAGVPLPTAKRVDDTFFASTITPGGSDHVWIVAGTSGPHRDLVVVDNDTGAETVLLTDANPQLVTPRGSFAIFSAESTAGDEELWRSDGTIAGTEPLDELNPAGSFNPSLILGHSTKPHLVVDGDIGDGHQLYTIDVSVPTLELQPLNAEFAGGAVPEPDDRGGWWMSGSLIGGGAGLWKLNAPMTQMSERHQIATVTESSYPSDFVALGDDVVFVADDEGRGDELFRYDPRAEVVHPLPDMVPGPQDADILRLHSTGDKVYFVAEPDGLEELYTTDGTDIWRVSDTLAAPSFESPARLVPADGVLWFSAERAGDPGIWRTDGTVDGTKLMADLAGTRTIDGLTRLGSGAIFQADTLAENGVLHHVASDGTVTELGELLAYPSEGVGEARHTFAFGGVAAIADENGVVWFTNGTVGGTEWVPFADEGEHLSFGGDVVVAGGIGWVVFETTTTGEDHLLRIDPTNRSVSVFAADDFDEALAATDEFVVGESNSSDVAIFDVGAGTVTENAEAEYPYNAVVAGDVVYLVAEHPDLDNVVWRSDGTAAGTTPVSGTDADPDELAVIGETLYLALADDLVGTEPFQLDVSNDFPAPTTTTGAPTTTSPSSTAPTTTSPSTTTPTTTPSTPAPDLADGASAFVPLTPTRLFDTREEYPDTAGPKGKVGPKSSIEVSVGGAAGVPADATAVVLNVTVTAVEAPTFVTVWPTGQDMPLASSINIVPHQTRPNLVTVPLGTDGRVSFYSLAGVDVIADVQGYFAPIDQPVAAGRFVPIDPFRVFDTREAEPAPGPKGKVDPQETIEVQITGVGAVPSAGVDAVVINITGTAATDIGHVTVYPTGQALPDASTLNLDGPGATAPNLVVVPVGDGGKVSVYSHAGAHLLGDVTGYITDSSVAADTAGLFVAVDPQRQFDTRPGEEPPGPKGRLAPEETVDATLGAVGDIPDDATGVVMNVVGIGAPVGHLTAWPSGSEMPLASMLNFTELPTDTRANGSWMPLGDDGQVSFSLFSGGDLLADVSGYFLP